ncbi:MAG: patatin-like phospholipase family protein [Chloroflexota bacterium]
MSNGVEIGGAPTKKKALVLSGGGGRGAFQWGVMEALEALKWRPDIIVGTSIGSMNGAVYAVHGIQGVRKMWSEIRTRNMHRFFRFPPWNGIFDRKPWKKTLEKYAPEADLKQVGPDLYVVSIDFARGQPIVYTNASEVPDGKSLYEKVNAINHQHLLASSSIPHVYPWTQIENHALWDGAIMYNSPLRPAIDAGADQIMIVLLSPYVDLPGRERIMPAVPDTILGKAGHLLDLAIIATFENDFEQLRKINQKVVQRGHDFDYKVVEAAIIGPKNWLPAFDIIRYNPRRAERLRDEGIKAVAMTRERLRRNGWDSLK